MKMLARRSMLRGLAAAPAAAVMVAEQMKVAGIGGALGGNMGSNGYPGDAPAASGPMRFTNFASWFKKFEPRLREEAKHVHSLDPDLAMMHLPLPTLVRMQRARNYERIVADRQRTIEEKLSLKGLIEWWP